MSWHMMIVVHSVHESTLSVHSPSSVRNAKRWTFDLLFDFVWKQAAEKIEDRLRNLNDAHTKAVYEVPRLH